MAVFLGVLLAASFGSGDLLVGNASRRTPTLIVLAVAQAVADRPPDAFLASTEHALSYLRTGVGEPLMDGRAARAVLATLLAALDGAGAGLVVDVGGS